MSHAFAHEDQSRRAPHWRTRDGRQEILMLLPAVVLLVTFIIVPFVMSVPLSLTNQKLLPGPVPTKFIGIRNFERILADGGDRPGSHRPGHPGPAAGLGG